MTRYAFLSLIFIASSAFGAERRNVLFIAVDDLRPELGCYGHDHILSPNIDELAASGRLFKRAYCQQAVCNPSRTSLMTGLRPDTTGIVTNHAHFRTKYPDVVTLSQHFKNNGYHAQAIGKIYHGVFADGTSKTIWDTMGDPQSWSVPATRFGPRYYYTEDGIRQAKQSFESMYRPKNPEPDDWTQKLVFGPMTESPDVPDETLYDGKVAKKAVDTLDGLAKNDQSFFLAVGFIKPHTPFVAPKKYFDLYDPAKLSLVERTELPDGAPKFAGHRSGEIRRYTDQPNRDDIPEANARRMRHAYYACISYVDAQIGKVLSSLESNGLAQNTIVVLFGDHGYHLGEHGLWGKTTNFELDTRVPLIIRTPGMKDAGEATDSLTELVDLYPTLASLAGLEVPEHCEGSDLRAIAMSDPDNHVARANESRGATTGDSLGLQSEVQANQHGEVAERRQVARRRIQAPAAAPRLPQSDENVHLGLKSEAITYRRIRDSSATEDFALSQYPRGKRMGYSLRTDKWRYTEWVDRTTHEFVARELYPHDGNQNWVETKNVVEEPSNAKTVAALSSKLRTVAKLKPNAQDAALTMPQVFGDHMVLQANAKLPVWGTAAPNSRLTIKLGDETQEVVADANGEWQVRFPPRKASSKPTKLSVTSGDQRKSFTDVVFGEVWLCAGQSNMEWPLSKSTNGKAAIASADDKDFRLLNLIGGARGSSGRYGRRELDRLHPDKFCQGTWQQSNAKTSADFSAVAWYFGRKLREKLKVPVGLICPAIGGTPTEAWIPREAMEADPKLKGLVIGNWLENPILGEFCRDRAVFNLQQATDDGRVIPGDKLGPNHSFKPGFMWEAGIQPLVPYAIHGAVWYQGESNAESPTRVEQHGRLLPLMIRQWRKHWGQKHFPFAMVQLPALNREHWPLFRDQQRRIADQDGLEYYASDIGLVVTIDTGHPTNVHPPLKKPIGERLAAWAVTRTPDASNPHERPTRTRAEDGAMVVQFHRSVAPLKTNDGAEPKHFELAGSDGVFHPATAKVTSNNIVAKLRDVTVSSSRVPDPKYVRYLWRPYVSPEGLMVTSAGDLVTPFTSQTESELKEATQPRKRPNILLIVGEDHGCEFSCYGDKVIRTGHIDKLAKGGMLFETAYVTQAVCSPSRSSIFTGLYPHQNGQLGLATHQFSFFRQLPTTYSLMKQAGYATGLIGKTHILPLDAVEPFVDFRFQPKSNFAKKDLGSYAQAAGKFMSGAFAGDMYDRKDVPFFLTVNYPDAHWPLQPFHMRTFLEQQLEPEDMKLMPYIGEESDITRRMRKIIFNYYNCIARLDHCVGDVLQQLNIQRKERDTLVIFVGDHGAQMARGKVTAYEGGMRVPFIASWPGVIKPGQRSKALVSTIDLLPTFLDAAGLKPPKGLPGQSLLPVFKGKVDETFREYLACERNCDAAHITFPQRTIRDQQFKLIHSPVRDREDPASRYYRIHGATHWSGCLTDEELKKATKRTREGYARWLNPPEYQLYDLQSDPHEWKDLANDPSHAETKAKLIAALRQWQTDTRDPLADPNKLAMLMQETDAVNKAKRRSPKGGWQYLNYLNPNARPQTDPVVADKNVIFSTSFEVGKAGPFKTRIDRGATNGSGKAQALRSNGSNRASTVGLAPLHYSDDPVTMTATGTVSISTQFAKTGKRCLHMLGDTDNSLTFQLPKQLQSLRGISLHAERWTRRDPFAFSIDVKRGDKWSELVNLDSSTKVGARFLTHVQWPIPAGAPVTAIRFRTMAASKSGLLIDDLAFLREPPEEQTPRVVQVPTERLELLDSKPLFVSGTNDTHTYRIPAIITAKNGDLIAACDARRKNGADLLPQRTIDIAFRRSIDNGKTWSPVEIMDRIDRGGCSDPSLLLDRETGEIFCFYNFMVSDKRNKEFRFMYQSSRDHGKTWGKSIDFTDQVAKPELKLAFKFITSGRGIQLADGTLMHNFARVGKGGTIFASKDHGKTWQAVSDYSPADESKVVQLADGSLMVNSRHAVGQRYEHRSADGGKTWTTSKFGPTDPRCNASIMRYTFGGKDLLLFCNAASPSGRKNLAVRVSRNNGKTWSDGKVIDPGPSAYSEMTVLTDGTIGVLYEPGHTEVRFARFSLDALNR